MKKLKKLKARSKPAAVKPQAPLRTKTGVLVKKRVQQVIAGLQVPTLQHIDTAKASAVVDTSLAPLVGIDDNPYTWKFPEVPQ